jgi:hypothetical protein
MSVGGGDKKLFVINSKADEMSVELGSESAKGCARSSFKLSLFIGTAIKSTST